MRPFQLFFAVKRRFRPRCCHPRLNPDKYARHFPDAHCVPSVAFCPRHDPVSDTIRFRLLFTIGVPGPYVRIRPTIEQWRDPKYSSSEEHSSVDHFIGDALKYNTTQTYPPSSSHESLDRTSIVYFANKLRVRVRRSLRLRQKKQNDDDSNPTANTDSRLWKELWNYLRTKFNRKNFHSFRWKINNQTAYNNKFERSGLDEYQAFPCIIYFPHQTHIRIEPCIAMHRTNTLKILILFYCIQFLNNQLRKWGNLLRF